jgi:hypothetical protein
MRRPTPRRLLRYVRQGLGLRRFLQRPGDGRQFPQIPVHAMFWPIILGQILRARQDFPTAYAYVVPTPAASAWHAGEQGSSG